MNGTQAVEGPPPVFQERALGPPYYVKGLALGVPIYLVAAHLWVWVLIAPGFLRDGRPDFRQIYSSAYMIRTGHGSQLYDYNVQKEFQDRLVTRRDVALPYIRPAYEAFIFSPLTHFSFRTAYFIFLGLNVIFLGVCLALLWPWVQNLRMIYPWLPFALLFGFYPMCGAFLQGQDSVLLLALLIAAFALLTKQRAVAAGMVAGLGLFKFQILLPVALLFLLWRRWRFLLGFGVSGAVLAAVSIWVAGIAGTKGYIAYLSSVANLKPDSPQNPFLWRMMANVHGFVFGISGDHVSKLWQEAVIAILCAAILAWTGFRGLRMHNEATLLLLALPCAILVGHYAFMHDLNVLLLPMVVLFNSFLSAENGGTKRDQWIGRAAALMFVAPMIDSYFPQHSFLIAVAVLGLLLAVGSAGQSTPEFRRFTA
jgi:hypothetical protein